MEKILFISGFVAWTGGLIVAFQTHVILGGVYIGATLCALKYCADRQGRAN